jgi:D-alanine-D-alanine ligase
MIKVGIFFGGISREREVSFAGGRTVYDNLDKSLFEAIPIFVDPWGNFCLLDWAYIYKGSIRDFYPPVNFLKSSKNGFQVYAESLGNLSHRDQLDLLEEIGKPLKAESLSKVIDFAFLALHGNMAEDGTIQGLLEWLGIPYSGCGILPSAIGIQKTIQKELQINAGFASPAFHRIKRSQWFGALAQNGQREQLFESLKKQIGLPLVIKSASQGSSIGVSVLDQDNLQDFTEAVEQSFFIKYIHQSTWQSITPQERLTWVRTTADIREGLGMPLLLDDKLIYHPEELLKQLDRKFQTSELVTLSALQKENDVLVEGFIKGKEFSCIVIQDEQGKPIALPPTEIVKKGEVFDYRSKYLPGLSRKVTPIQIADKKIEEIRTECSRLFELFHCQVYARIDGFVSDDGSICLNDPNTTSGMMPSSFFFHQAAEIGLNPSQFLTYIIRTSLQQRAESWSNSLNAQRQLSLLEHHLEKNRNAGSEKIKVAVIMGGYSSERHISVESGRNIYEKLSSSDKYHPIPVFLTGNSAQHELYIIPVNMMLKDNADDIREKVLHYKEHQVLKKIKNECSVITDKYAPNHVGFAPQKIDYDGLAEICNEVFIALHGRPGEDGAIQEKLDALGLTYNGSGVESSRITINKFETNNILREHGFIVADSMLMQKDQWLADEKVSVRLVKARIGFPLIAKPVDDGCSSAVKKITNEQEFILYAKAIFRDKDDISEKQRLAMALQPKEEFPRKESFLVERLIDKGECIHFLEITGGLLTQYDDDGGVDYEMFEPSETLAEGAILSLEEKFLAGEGQNITPARYAPDKKEQKRISKFVRHELKKAAKLLAVEGYARIDAFVRIYDTKDIEVNIIEVNSLPGMTPATCIFHQCAINGYKPYDFIDSILKFGKQRKALKS